MKYLLNVNSLDIIWFNFFIINIEQGNLGFFSLVRNLYFNCSATGFLNFLTRVTLSENSRSSTVLQRCRWKLKKKKIAREISKLSEKNIPVDVFIILQLCRSARVRRKWISGEKKDRKTTTLQETQADQVF